MDPALINSLATKGLWELVVALLVGGGAGFLVLLRVSGDYWWRKCHERHAAEHRHDAPAVWWACFLANAPAFEQHLRTQTFASDYARVEKREAAVTTLDRKADALQDAITGLSAAQQAQGRALEEIPRLSQVLERLDTTLAGVNKTLEGVQREVKDLGKSHYETRGLIEGWRDDRSSEREPQRPRRARKAASQ